MRETSKTEQAVKAAYDAGVIAGKNIGVTLGIEMGMKRATDIMSRDLHNFKFPEGQIPIGMPLEAHAPKDNSTFEFTYERYEERMKKKSAELEEENDRRRSYNNRVHPSRRVKMNRK